MKKISSDEFPCYNEEENVREICAAVIDVLEKRIAFIMIYEIFILLIIVHRIRQENI